MERSFDRAVVAVTGGASGIGRAIGQTFARQGARVASLDPRPLSSPSDVELAFEGDTASAADIRRFHDAVTNRLGIPSVLVANAGVWLQEKLAEGDPEKWARLLNINVIGALRFLRAFLPSMLQAGHGDVVFTSSVSANKPLPYGGVYAASKSALDTIAETVRIENIPKIRVTVISPGVVDTGLFAASSTGPKGARELGVGALDPQEVADAVIFALSRPHTSSLNRITLRPTHQEY